MTDDDKLRDELKALALEDPETIRKMMIEMGMPDPKTLDPRMLLEMDERDQFEAIMQWASGFSSRH